MVVKPSGEKVTILWLKIVMEQDQVEQWGCALIVEHNVEIDFLVTVVLYYLAFIPLVLQFPAQLYSTCSSFKPWFSSL